MRLSAKSTSSAVFCFPKLKRRLARARSAGIPMAVSTCEGSIAPEEQAAPVETAIPLRSRAIVTSAVQHGPKLRSLSRVESAHALRPVHLVSGDGEQIAADFPDADRYLSRSLHGVRMEVHISFRGDLGDLLY